MRAYQEQDFEKMASRVVDRFMGGEKLADVAAMEAQQGQLNPDQIERLVHSANTQAFLRLMDQQKAQGTPDMTGEFDPIDTRQVMQHMMAQTPDMCPPEHEMPGMDPHAQHDMSDVGPLPNEMHDNAQPSPFDRGDGAPADAPGIEDDNDGPFAKGKKQKEKDDADKPKKKAPASKKDDTEKEAAFRSRRVNKLAGILEDQYKQAELAFDDTFQNLSMCLKKAHGAPNAAQFEKDALALHGDEIGIAMLNMVKAAHHWPVISLEDAASKTAALHDRHIVDDTDANRAFATLVKIATEALRLKQGAEYARSQCS